MNSKQPTPIKTDLFRFVTIRTPQLITEEKKQWGFIPHPDPSNSFFLKQVNTDNISIARSGVREVLGSFKPVNSADDIKKKFAELYNFSSWLIRNRNTLTEQETTDKLKNVKKLNEDELIQIWDNLFYQVLKCNSPTLRQVCIQLIAANNFIVNIKTAEIKKIAENFIQTPKTPLAPEVKERLNLFLRRLAKSKVIIPKAFSTERQNTDTSNEKGSAKPAPKMMAADTTNKKTSSEKGTDNTEAGETEIEAGKLYGVNKLGIGVLRRVEQEVCCYVPGEVSRIENILAREYKERQTRSLISTEITEEDTTEIEVENQSDTVSTSRNELQSEIANSITNDNSINTGASLGVTAQGGFLGNGGSVTADGYFDFASSTSSTASDSEAQTYAQEVTNSALERVLQKTTQKRTSRVLQEFEENNRHGFDNREGTQHVTGVYRWVDIIYTNRLINYGKRLMFEFLIPEPAKFYRDVMKKKGKNNSGKSGGNLPKPKEPSFYGLDSASDLIGYDLDTPGLPEENYQSIAEKYGVEISAPPAQKSSVEQTFAKTDIKETKEFSGTGIIPIPPGYHCNNALVDVEYRHDSRNSQGTHWVVTVGGDSWNYNIENDGNDDRDFSRKKLEFKFGNYLTQTVGVSFSGDRTLSYHISITIICEILPQEYSNWQNDGYKKIMDAYKAQLAEYEAAIAKEKDEKTTEETSSVSNPDFNRTVEQREIQRIAIEMLTKPFDIPMGDDFYYETRKCKIPQVEQTKKWEKYSSRVKFFEQAFDWKMMAYLFYPYYWADKCDWRDLFQTEPADDPIFESFLQSGMARSVIPVRKGFEEAVNYYLETGDIWNGGGLVMDTDDDLYLSIDEELQEAEGFVDQEWQTRVPTTLTIVQGKSVYLEDESLPCCDEEEKAGVDTLLRPSTAILGEKTANK